MDRGFLTLPREVPGSFARSFGAQARGLGPAGHTIAFPLHSPAHAASNHPRVPRRGDGWRTCRQSQVFEDGDHRHGFGDRAMDPPPPSARAPELSVIDDDDKPVHKSPVGSDTGYQVSARIEIHTEDDCGTTSTTSTTGAGGNGGAGGTGGAGGAGGTGGAGGSGR
jgi:hypothetical protein